MNRSQQVKKIIGEAIAERGFEFAGNFKDGYVHGWSFKRSDGDLIQYITIPIIDDVIRLGLSTNAPGQRDVFAHRLIESDFSSYNNGLVFDNDTEFKQILELYRDIILEKSPEVFERISKPSSEAAPRKETYLKLYQDHNALNAEYRAKYGLEETKSTMTLIKKLSETILATTDKKFSEVEDMLVGLAAVYSDQFILKCSGEWEWNDKFNSCIIDKIHGNRCVNPLVRMINYWKSQREDLNILLDSFKKTPSDIID